MAPPWGVSGRRNPRPFTLRFLSVFSEVTVKANMCQGEPRSVESSRMQRAGRTGLWKVAHTCVHLCELPQTWGVECVYTRAKGLLVSLCLRAF